MSDIGKIADLVDRQNTEFKSFIESQESRLEKLEVKMDTPMLAATNDADRKFELAKSGVEQYVTSGVMGTHEYDKGTIIAGTGPEAAQMSIEIATVDAGGYLHVRQLDEAIMAAVGEMNPLMAEVRQVSIQANEFRQVFTTTRNATARAAENDPRSETATANFVVSDVTLYDLYALPTITNEILNGTGFDIMSWVVNDVAESFSTALGEEFVIGDGVKQSTGLLNSVSTNLLGGTPDLPWGSIHSIDTSPTITYEMLLTAISRLPIRYKAAGNAKWYMSTSAIEAARGLKDANGLPIWRQDFGIAGAPMVLLGYPVVEVPQLDGKSHTVMFGDMRQAYAFVHNDRGMGIIVDRITSKGFTKIYSSKQCAGAVMDSRAMVALAV